MGSTELRVYNLAECCRILKCPFSNSSIAEASAILDPGQSGIISFENFSMWWFSGQRSVPKGAEYLKLSTNINISHRYAKSKRGLYRAYTSMGFIRRRIQKKEKALRKIKRQKNGGRQKQMVVERKKKVQIEEDARVAKKRKKNTWRKFEF